MKRKIGLNFLYLSQSHAGGKDQVGLNLLKGFHDNGAGRKFLIICFEYSREILQSIAPEIEIIAIPYKGGCSELGRMLFLCYVNTFVVPRLIEKHSIGLVYHLNINTGLRKLSVPEVVIPHDIKAVSQRVLANVKVPMYKHILYRVLYYCDFRKANKIIAISEFDKGEITGCYRRFATKITMIYNPICIDENLVNKIVAAKSEKKYVCAVNLQFHHKNIITLIKAFEILKGKVDYKLVLIGKVPSRVQYLKDYVKEHQLEDIIIFTGLVSEEELHKLFVGSSLYVNPTLYEGFGMTAVEAMIWKIPTLVSMAAANYETTGGLAEYYEPAEDAAVLAQRIQDIMKSPTDNMELEEHSKIMMRQYHYTKISKQYMELFENIMN